MKKYGMLLLNPLFNPKEHTALFLIGNIENHIFTVRNEDEALEKTKDLIKKEFGVLKIYDISKGHLCIGHVKYLPAQEMALQE